MLAQLGTPFAICKVSGGKEAMKEKVEPAKEKRKKFGKQSFGN